MAYGFVDFFFLWPTSVSLLGLQIGGRHGVFLLSILSTKVEILILRWSRTWGQNKDPVYLK